MKKTPWTVLIIDDQTEEVTALIQHLESEGYRVLFTSGGQSGLEVIGKERPDTIICDLEMPGLGGYAVLEAITGNPATRDIPFLLMNDEWTIGPDGNWSRPRNGKTAECHLPKPLSVREVACFLGRLSGRG